MSILKDEIKMLQQQVAKTGILDLSYRDLTSCPEFVWKLCEYLIGEKREILTFFFLPSLTEDVKSGAQPNYRNPSS
jgi:hypothetical protein